VGKAFGRDALDVGLLFAWIGLVLMVTQGVLLRRLVARVGETRLVVIGLVAMAVGRAAVALAPDFRWFFAVGTVIAFGNGVTFPSFTSLYSKACQAENSGELLGQSQAMATTGRIVGPVCGGLVMQHWSLGMPFLIAGLMMLVALAMFEAFRGTLVVADEV